jgi:hypothetical protein
MDLTVIPPRAVSSSLVSWLPSFKRAESLVEEILSSMGVHSAFNFAVCDVMCEVMFCSSDVLPYDLLIYNVELANPWPPSNEKRFWLTLSEERHPAPSVFSL